MATDAPVFSLRRLWIGSKIHGMTETRLAFAVRETGPLHLEFYRAESAENAPCLLVLHTGGWENGTPAEFQTLNRYLARRGVAVAAMEYRLAPRWTWPAQREDVIDAIQFLKEHAGELGLDGERFVLMGRSAGGQIAEAVAYGDPELHVCGSIGFYCPADLLFAFQYADKDDILNSYKLLTQYLGGTPEEKPDNYHGASGILHVNARSVPTLLVHGCRDELVWFRQSARLAERLSANGVPHLLLDLPWATHACDHNFDGPSGQIVTWVVERFLNYVLTERGPFAEVAETGAEMRGSY